MSADLVDPVLEALLASVDRARFGRALEALAPRSTAAGDAPDRHRTAAEVLRKIVLSDILDESILSARPGDTSYVLRLFLGALSEDLASDTAFALASGLNLFFRVEGEEEARLHIAVEVSRLYYRWVQDRALEEDHVRELSPLLARLMSTQLEHLALESVDAARVFDSSLHERVPGSDPARPSLRAPKSFLARVVSTGRVRAKAWVRT